MIKEVGDQQQKQRIARLILEQLTDWFGLAQAREQYILQSAQQQFFVAYDNTTPVGFLCLKATGPRTVEIAVMGVLKAYQHQKIGTRLFEVAKNKVKQQGYHFVQVKTVQCGVYPQYDATNKFYQSLGFEQFEVIPTLWDEHNPCQIYVMHIQ